MNERDKNYALSIIQSIMKKPFAEPFVDPVDSDEDWSSSYYKKIKKPMDLTQIMEKIENDKYQSLDEWKSDVSLIWNNAKTYFGENSFVTKLSLELKKFFDKLTNQNQPISPGEWCREVLSIKDTFVSYISKNPASKINDFCECLLGQNEYPDLSKKEKKDIIKASEALSSTPDARAMFGIIHGMNPNVHAVSEDVKLDLKTISPRSLHMLQFYVKTRLIEEGLDYPQ